MAASGTSIQNISIKKSQTGGMDEFRIVNKFRN